jgi:protein-disulfide isomerase
MAATAAASADIEAELKKNFQLAGALGATGTPLFVVGNRVINSAVGYDELKKAVEAARAKG